MAYAVRRCDDVRIAPTETHAPNLCVEREIFCVYAYRSAAIKSRPPRVLCRAKLVPIQRLASSLALVAPQASPFLAIAHVWRDAFAPIVALLCAERDRAVVTRPTLFARARVRHRAVPPVLARIFAHGDGAVRTGESWRTLTRIWCYAGSVVVTPAHDIVYARSTRIVPARVRVK